MIEASGAGFEAALAEHIERSGAELLVLAGFMRILSAAFVQRYSGRLINIHPSLLPKYKGLHTHRRALQAGERALTRLDPASGRSPNRYRGPSPSRAAVALARENSASADEDLLRRRFGKVSHVGT